MILKRELLKAVAHAATDDASRFDLTHMQVQPDGRVVATDGHWLLIGKDKYADKDDDFPSAGLPSERKPLSKPALLSTAVIEKLIKAMPKGKLRIPILGAVLVAERNQEPDAAAVSVKEAGEAAPIQYAAATDLDVPVVATLNGQDLSFPAWERVLVKADRPHIKLTLSATLLERLVKAAKDVHKINPAVTLEIPTEKQHQTAGAIHSQVRFTLGSDSFEVEGVVMPMRL